MNKLTIIGNLTRAPELRTTATGLSVCTFTVAVNRRQNAQQRQQDQRPDADFFKVTAWRERGETCAKYLDKGKKVCVIGPVSMSTYTGNDGQTRANMEITAEEVEFLSPLESKQQTTQAPSIDPQTGYEQVDTGDLPF